MSMEYDIYLKAHIENVRFSGDWMFNNIPLDKLDDILPNLSPTRVHTNLVNHDISKYNFDEYEAYDDYFYHGGKDTEEGREKFGLAFSQHIRNNPHHWQHWVLIDDDGNDSLDGHQIRAFDIPDDYIFEMIADWWSFSRSEFMKSLSDGTPMVEAYQKLYGIFDWYDSHKGTIIFSSATRKKVESLLDLIYSILQMHRPLE